MTLREKLLKTKTFEYLDIESHPLQECLDEILQAVEDFIEDNEERVIEGHTQDWREGFWAGVSDIKKKLRSPHREGGGE